MPPAAQKGHGHNVDKCSQTAIRFSHAVQMTVLPLQKCFLWIQLLKLLHTCCCAASRKILCELGLMRGL